MARNRTSELMADLARLSTELTAEEKIGTIRKAILEGMSPIKAHCMTLAITCPEVIFEYEKSYDRISEAILPRVPDFEYTPATI